MTTERAEELYPWGQTEDMSDDDFDKWLASRTLVYGSRERALDHAFESNKRNLARRVRREDALAGLRAHAEALTPLLNAELADMAERAGLPRALAPTVTYDLGDTPRLTVTGDVVSEGSCEKDPERTRT